MLVLRIFLALLATCQCKIVFNKGARTFSMQLLNHTVQDTQWHDVKSPLGIWSLLATMTIGATGKSRDQLLQTLNLPKTKKNFEKKYNKFMKSVISPPTPDIQFKYNNFVFLDTGFTTEPQFEEKITNGFGAKVTRINFNSSEAADSANNVIRETDSSISDVFQPDDFNDATMILTNTISFKGHWQFPFNSSDTQVKDFHDEMGKVIGKVNMMLQQGKFQVSNIKKISANVLELPYGTTNKYSFLAVLPHENVPLANVGNALVVINLKDILNRLEEDTEQYGLAEVVVNLPRFKINTNFVVNKPLISMGLVDIFDPWKARFNRISKTAKLSVSAIVQKAEIEVTETGTIASAATSAFFADRSLPLTFNACRPFLYFVIEKSTATIIFSGAYSLPTIY